jgi:prepilin-type N-terminal cleavage/methylation domain-containing protein
MTNRFKKSGFTLIELAIYIAILSVVTVVVADSFLILNKGRGGVEAKSDLNSNLRFATEKIKRDITSASNLITPDTTAASSTLLNLTISGASVKYTLNNNRVTRQVDAAPFEYITSDTVKINNLYFNRLENINTVFNKKRISVEINISASYNSASPDWQYNQSDRTSVDLNQDF